MAKLSVRIVTECVAVDFFGTLPVAVLSCQPATVTSSIAVPLDGMVNDRLATSPPDVDVSTVAHEPSVNLNSMVPRTSLGSVIAQRPLLSAESGVADGFHALNDPAT